MDALADALGVLGSVLLIVTGLIIAVLSKNNALDFLGIILILVGLGTVATLYLSKKKE